MKLICLEGKLQTYPSLVCQLGKQVPLNQSNPNLHPSKLVRQYQSFLQQRSMTCINDSSCFKCHEIGHLASSVYTCLKKCAQMKILMNNMMSRKMRSRMILNPMGKNMSKIMLHNEQLSINMLYPNQSHGKTVFFWLRNNIFGLDVNAKVLFVM